MATLLCAIMLIVFVVCVLSATMLSSQISQDEECNNRETP